MTFDSVYSMITPPTEVKKQWFVDYFYGDSVKTWWNKASGCGCISMTDAIDGGLCLTRTGSEFSWTFFDKRHYDPCGTAYEVIMQRVSCGATTLVFSGLSAGQCLGAEHLITLNDNGTCFIELDTRNCCSTSQVSTSTATDENFHRFRSTLDGTTAILWVCNQLEATSTSCIPDLKMGPVIGTGNIACSQARFRYYEAYNT